MNIRWQLLVALIGSIQWLAIAGWSSFSRARFARNGTMRHVEKALVLSSVVMVLSWLVHLDPTRLWKASQPVAVASTATTTRGSCATIEEGMTIAQVKTRLGEPDEVRANEETRGPGAKTFVYRGRRCAVHLFHERVDFIE